jgi:hypothetical protein
VDSERDVKIRAAVYATFGGLWLALTGACTWGIAKDGENLSGLWHIGLWFMSAGVLPLVIGLRSFLPRRMLGSGLSAVAAVWLGWGLKLLADIVLDAVKSSGGVNGYELAGVAMFWLIYQAPGAAMLWGGIAILKAKPDGRTV